MKDKASDVIEVRLAEGHVQVLRNQKVLHFTEQRWMDVRGEMIYTILTSCTLNIFNLDGPNWQQETQRDFDNLKIPLNIEI